jgi:hypothetical protein
MNDWAKMIGITPAELMRSGTKRLLPFADPPPAHDLAWDLDRDLPGRHRHRDTPAHHESTTASRMRPAANRPDLAEREGTRGLEEARRTMPSMIEKKIRSAHPVADAALRDLLADPHDPRSAPVVSASTVSEPEDEAQMDSIETGD